MTNLLLPRSGTSRWWDERAGLSRRASRKLGKKARSAMQAVEEGRGEAWIPAVVGAEIVLLRELGRIEIGLAHLKTAMEQAPGLRFLSLDLRKLDEFAALGAIRDPFDRLIVSAARAVGAKLVRYCQMLWTEPGAQAA